MKKKTITLKNDDIFLLDGLEIESNCENIIQFENEVNDQITLLAMQIPEDSSIAFAQKINAPNLPILWLGGGGSIEFMNNFDKYFFDQPELTTITLSSTGIKKIPDFILRSKQLKKLTFSNENITEMPSELFDLKHLKNLSFEVAPNLKKVPDEIKRLTNLEWFDLLSAKLDYVSPELFKLPKLRYANFAYCSYNPCKETEEVLNEWLIRKNNPRFSRWNEPADEG